MSMCDVYELRIKACIDTIYCICLKVIESVFEIIMFH